MPDRYGRLWKKYFPVILRTHAVIFSTTSVISRIYLVIFRIYAVIFRTNPVIFYEKSSTGIRKLNLVGQSLPLLELHSQFLLVRYKVSLFLNRSSDKPFYFIGFLNHLEEGSTETTG